MQVPFAKLKLAQRVLEQCLEATPAQMVRMKQVLAQDRGAPDDVRAAAAADGNVLEALFDHEAELTVDLLIGVQAALKAPPGDKPAGGKGEKEEEEFPAKVTIVIPKRVSIEAVNAAVLAAHGKKFAPIPEGSKKDGAVIRCGRKMADELKRGFKVQGHQIERQGRAEGQDSTSKEEESEEEEVTPKKVKGGKAKRKAAKAEGVRVVQGKGTPWGFACFGCGGRHKWGDCELTSPVTKMRCERCGQKGHERAMCKVSRDARAEFEEKYGSPMQWLSKKLAVAERDSSSSEESSEDEDSESGDDWIKPRKGTERKRSSGKGKKGDKKLKKRTKEESRKKEKKRDKKEAKEKGSGKKKTGKRRSKRSRDDSLSPSEDSSSEEDKPRSKKKSRKEQEADFEAGRNPSERLLRMQWDKRTEKMASGPSNSQGGQGFGQYPAQSPSPYYAQGYGTVGGGSGQQWLQPAVHGQRYGTSQAAPQGAAGQGDADWAG